MKQNFYSEKIICVLLAVVYFYSQLHLVMMYAFSHEITLVDLVCGLLLFKVGEQIHVVFDGLSKNFWICVACIFLLIVLILPQTIYIYLFFSFSFMKVRDAYRSSNLRYYKILGRAIGFILSPLSSVYLIALAPILFILCWLNKSSIDLDPKIKINVISTYKNLSTYLLMMLHHCHYFVYAYSIPILYATSTSIKNNAAGVMFFVGWLAYNAYEKLIKPNKIYFLLGHVLLSISLIALFYATTFQMITILWFLTGLGGGTVYMLQSFIPKLTTESTKDLRIFEGFGHIIGLSCWGGVLLIGYSYRLTFMLGGILGLIVVVVTFLSFMEKKIEKNH